MLAHGSSPVTVVTAAFYEALSDLRYDVAILLRWCQT